MKKDRDAYIVITPTGKSKIYYVACRKIGSRDRFAVIAPCMHEVNADSIVDGLKLLQGEKVKLDVPAQRVLEEVREQLGKERAIAEEWRTKARKALLEHETKLSEANHKIRTLEAALRAAQSSALEKA